MSRPHGASGPASSEKGHREGKPWPCAPRVSARQWEGQACHSVSLLRRAAILIIIDCYNDSGDFSHFLELHIGLGKGEWSRSLIV